METTGNTTSAKCHFPFVNQRNSCRHFLFTKAKIDSLTAETVSALESLFLKVDGINVKCASLAAIADSCPNLRVISIADIGQNVKVAMLDHLIGNCLELAVIEGCSHISNKQQSLILQTRIKKLK